jgi:hypothetical protein
VDPRVLIKLKLLNKATNSYIKKYGKQICENTLFNLPNIFKEIPHWISKLHLDIITINNMKFLKNIHTLVIKEIGLTMNEIKSYTNRTIGNDLPISYDQACSQVLSIICKTRFMINDSLIFLSNIHHLKINGVCYINDDGLKHLSGIHTLCLENCRCKITHNGLKYLKGINKLCIHGGHVRICDRGLKYLKGIKHLELTFTNITGRGLKYLAGIEYLSILDHSIIVLASDIKCLKGIKVIWMPKLIDDSGVALSYIMSKSLKYARFNGSYYSHNNIWDEYPPLTV